MTLLDLPSIDTTGERLLLVAGVLALVAIATRMVQAIATRRLDAVERRYRIRKLVSFLGYGVGGVAALTIMSDDLGGLTVALGVAGAGIAFALQEVIASVAGWFAISFAGFYKPGDRVQLGGIKGDVIDIGLLRTTLMEVGEWVTADLYSGRVVRIANSFVFKEPVFNYSGEFPFLWDEIMVPLKYGSDWRMARDALTAVAHEVVDDFTRAAAGSWRQLYRTYMVEETTVEPTVTLRPTDNWIELKLRYVVDYRVRRTIQDQLFTRFLEEVDRSAGRIGFASQTIQVIEGSAMNVTMHGPGTASAQRPGGAPSV